MTIKGFSHSYTMSREQLLEFADLEMDLALDANSANDRDNYRALLQSARNALAIARLSST